MEFSFLFYKIGKLSGGSVSNKASLLSLPTLNLYHGSMALHELVPSKLISNYSLLPLATLMSLLFLKAFVFVDFLEFLQAPDVCRLLSRLLLKHHLLKRFP